MKNTLKMMAVIGSVMVAQGAFAEGSTETFLKSAIEGNLAEIQMGKLAQAKGSTDVVRAYGKTLEADHMQANVNAVKTAAAVGVEVPTRPSNEQQAEYKKMAKLSGVKFDKEFIGAMVDDHKDDVELYQKESAKTEDGEVASYARATLPVIQGHLNVATDLKAKM